MIEIIAEEIFGMIREWWKAVGVVLIFAAVGCVVLAVGGETVTFREILKTIFNVMIGVGVIALGFLVERIYRRLKKSN